VVAFSAAGSTDPDGSIVSYVWNFGDGASGSGVNANHTYAAAGTFTITLTVTDNDAAMASTTRTVTATSGPPPAGVTVSGRITFERVPFSATPESGLDYTAIFEAPAREIEIDLVRTSDQAVLASTATDLDGYYSVVGPVETSVFLRAKALSRHAGAAGRPAGWDIRVRNNTNGNALYVMDSSAFGTGTTDRTLNLKAATGWGGGFAGYTGTRAAAPFAVLDTVYAATQFVIAEGDASAQLMPLSVYWSPDNVPATGDETLGQIGTTSYLPAGIPGVSPGIYVLGDENNDTDEFDQHVIAHEYLHYLEDAVGRTDTTGGSHSLDERLDMRLAFSEGYGNAFSAMVLADPVYRDSFGGAQGSDFGINVESRSTTAPGWYSETSVQRIVWDLFDAANEGNDAVTLGYGPLHDVFTTELRDGVPLTSLFPFVTALKQRAGVPVALVDALVAADSLNADLGIVAPTMDAYATTETHDGGSEASLPVYTATAVGGTQTVCTDRALGIYNALGNRRFLRFNLSSARSLTINVTCATTPTSTCTGAPTPDPDFVLSRAGTRWVAEEVGPTESLGPLALVAGDYVIEVYEYSHLDPSLALNERRGRTCMTVNITD